SQSTRELGRHHPDGDVQVGCRSTSVNVPAGKSQPHANGEAFASGDRGASQDDLNGQDIIRNPRDRADLVSDELTKWVTEAHLMSTDVDGGSCCDHIHQS